MAHSPASPFSSRTSWRRYAGVRITWGSAFLSDNVPDHDSELVARLQARRPDRPRQDERAGVRHPAHDRTARLRSDAQSLEHRSAAPGGRAAGRLPRWPSGWWRWPTATTAAAPSAFPASCCGLFGLKPTRARNPLEPGPRRHHGRPRHRARSHPLGARQRRAARRDVRPRRRRPLLGATAAASVPAGGRRQSRPAAHRLHDQVHHRQRRRPRLRRRRTRRGDALRRPRPLRRGERAGN